MESPPMYAPPPKKSRSGLIIALVVLAVVVCCGLPSLLIGGGWFFLNKNGKGFIGCIVSLEPLQKATLAYARDHGGKLPPSKNWEELVRPYYKKQIGHKELGPWKPFPVEGPWGCDEPSGRTGIALNTDVAGKVVSSIKDTETIMLFEVPKAGKDLARPYKTLNFTDSPTMMGMDKNRGWFVVPIDGEVMVISRGGKKVNVNTNSNGFQIKTGD